MIWALLYHTRLEMKINWESFKVYEQDARGIKYKFEDLCRQLFANENLSANRQFRYLHANPNNAGLETEPIYDEANKRWIGFQAKYFDGDVDYSKIKQSANMIVKYYTKEQTVDLVYLFCNKPITSTANKYVETVKMLEKSNIELQLITDTAILDLVRNKYPYLGLYYFGNHTIGHDWFINHTKKIYDQLGERYNQDFNVETEFSYELSLFLHDQYARDSINNKKKKLISEIEKIYTRYDKERTYLKILKDTVMVLPDVNSETLIDSVEWKNKVVCAVESYLNILIEEKSKLEEKKNEFYVLAFNGNENGNSRESAKNKYYEIRKQIYQINTLLELPNIISFSEREKKLLYGNIMIVSGKAGTGKSHLLSYKTNMLLNENRMALLLLAGIYYTNSPICEQIMSNLGLKYSFEGLIDILETIGERDNCIIPIFIDALNETWNHKLWKNDLKDIIDIIADRHMVKLVLSYRPEYEDVLISNSVLKNKNNGKFINLVHTGFEENSVSAVREFLNHYNIPFSPLEYFGVEMSNPLFLTLYCTTYNGEDVSLPKLYERIIEKVSEKIFTILDLRSKGFFESDNILNPFIKQISEYMMSNNCRCISRTDLIKLTFWTEYGINVAPFIGRLVKEGLLYTFRNDNIEYYYFAYDQMNDYYFAKAIMTMCSDKKDVQDFLVNNILKIKDGKLNNLGAIDIFVNVCALYAEQYGEECIDIIAFLREKHDQGIIFSRYINSLQWRNLDYINKNLISDLLRKYPCKSDDLWSMLIGNSIKVGHPLNANFLHEFLSDYELNKRDYLWTTYINDLPSQDENRVIQLIKMYDCGDKLENVNQEQIELLLILFGWMLTSSNRWLRDYASKAMIEILKDHFQFCNVILEKFNYVDDPYVVQRLYGVVFGACCKRKSGSLETLAEYVYENIFNQEKVYPDILLRDYARLIVEKFLCETPNYNGIIVREKISPPYNSEPIPDIEDQHYENKEYDGAILKIVMSMRIEKMGGYGDFGRYIFQSALHSFDVDEKKMFNYAVYHILNELGFNEKLFDIHDGYCGYYDRHTTVKKERIGKKYQWITLYNMLARISDHYKMVDQWSYPSKKEVLFEGSWDPYVRDFDPTLNVNFMVCNDAPIFKILEEHVAKGKAENNSFDISNEAVQKVWLEEKGIFLSDIKSTLILTDANDEKWICLTKYCGTGRENLNIEKLCVWSWLYAYFVTPKQEKAFSTCIEKGLSVINQKVASHHETYSVFNREYPWSPSCREFDEYAWVDAWIKTGEVEIVKQTVPFPDISLIREYDEELDKKIDVDILHESDNLCRQVTREQEIKKEIGKILHATTGLIWEEEYDATKESTISRSFPCATLIELMGLRQLVSDGFFYDTQGKLAAFDTDLTQNVNSVVVRKDILDEFLIKTGMKLIWLVDAEKEIHTDDYSTVKWSDWEAVFSYNGDNIDGEIHRIR